MTDKESKQVRAEFVYLSILFWAFVAMMSAFWRPVYELMQQVIIMHSEYSLLEQGTKVLILVIFFGASIAYCNEQDRPRIILGLTFVLFSLALYFSESNFIVQSWQPVFGAVFILMVAWQLLRIDRIAILPFLLGCFLLGLGVVSDTLLDKPELLPAWDFFLRWQAIAREVEEHFDIWGVAFISYASVVVFRAPIVRVMKGSPQSFLVLIISIGLIAAGNSFAHWQYRPSKVFEVIATAMAVAGIVGVSHFDSSNRLHGRQFAHVDRATVYFGLVMLFVVLPIIYGGSGAPFNLVLWAGFFYLFGKVLYQSHPILSDTKPSG